MIYGKGVIMPNIRHRQVTVFVLCLAIVVGLFLGVVLPARAVYIPFGGPIIWTVPGDGCLAIAVGPPRPGLYVFQFGLSIPYAWWNLFKPGTFVLGLATIPTPCFIGFFPVWGALILRVGTGL